MAVTDADIVARLRLNARDFNDDLKKAIGDAAKRLGDLDQGLRGVDRAARQSRAGMAQAGQQIQDITIQAQQGTPAFVIFGQQIGQTATALSLMGGKLGAVGSFLAGPWGAAITAAVIGLGVLYNSTRDAGDGADAQKEKVKTLAEALEDLDKVSGVTARSEEGRFRQAIANAAALRDEEIAIRSKTKALLDGALVDAERKAGLAVPGGRAANQGFVSSSSEADKTVTRLRAQIAEQDKKIGAANGRIELNEGYFRAAQAADAATSASKRLEQQLDRERDAARARYQVTKDEAALTVALTSIEQRRAAARTADRDARRGARAGDRVDDRYEKELRALQGKREQLGLIAGELTLEATIEAEILALRERNHGLDAARLASLEAETRELLTQKAIVDSARGSDKVIDGLGKVDAGALSAGERAATAELDRLVQAIDDRRFDAVLDRWAEERRQAEDLAFLYEDLFVGGADRIWKQFKGQGIAVLSRLATGFKIDGKIGLDAATSGTLFESIGKIFKPSGKDGDAASGPVKAASGLLGNVKGMFAPNGAVGQAIGAVGKAMPYIGAALAGFSILKGLLASAPKATSTVTTGANGATAGAATGSKSLRDAAQKLGDAFAEEINRIAESLGGDVVDGLTLGSIGKRKSNFVYDPTGQGRTKGAGVISSKNEAEVQLAAFKDAVRDGAIGGTSQTVLNALLGGTSISDAQGDAQKVATFLRDAKRLDDPLGAALDEVDDKFKSLEKTLKASSATAEEMAQFERLRASEIRKATEEATSSLRGFRDSLIFGSGSPLSLRDQEAAARANFDKFEADILAGKAVDQDKFVEAGRAFLDVQRNLNGSTSGYFEQFNRVQNLTNRAIATVENAAPINPLQKATADATAATARATDSMDQTLTQMLEAIRSSVAGGGATAAQSTFIGGSGRYVRNTDVRVA